ncbi:tRNA-uridine aminocarboxypropyltransferase [Tenacibaculum finnmarkense]|nr:tRNA-uridine aminocarboxypropyltransferase [Tenacibaculum finnmarkense]MCD8410353.1 DTW domain-containing protein [Tenacibaculum finnmarkense genomovar ulcerans]MCD8422788.1 DTW domain-containing protein [Tenacibaculum finnmarkense genomovar ulcerans]MCD8445184.1 DTW domain-containing protein [Tenacibaculum finnmarkense genomovar ulcerans]
MKTPRITCYKCMMPSSSCICKHTNNLQTKTRFIILMHPKEYKKEKNGTGRMTNLQLENSEIIVGVDFTNNKRVNEILTEEKNGAFLLYPGEDSLNLSVNKSSEINSFMGDNPHIFILDGTWPCARKMLKLSENLQQLKRVSFDNKIKSKFSIKQQPAPLCLSTIESVYTVLNLLNQSNLEQCDTKNFLVPFEKMIDHQIKCMLNTNNKELIPKNVYKKNMERSIIFEQEN